MNRSKLSWEERALAAEKTVDVLKGRVRALYAGDVASSIQKQLERSNKRQDEARRRREMIEMRAAELARHSERLEGEVKERTRDIRRILDNVTSGFLVLGPDLRVLPGYTESCRELLATDAILGRTLPELLQIRRAADAEHVSALLEQIFADIMPEEITTDMLPRRYQVGDRAIRIDLRVIREEGSLQALLLTLNDITSLEEAQRKAFVNQVLIGVLKQKTAFQDFALDARTLFGAARKAIYGGDVVVTRRALHTVKGNAAAFDLVELVETIHHIESKEAIGIGDIDSAEAALRQFFVANESVLELSYDELGGEGPESREALTPYADGSDVERWTNKGTLTRAERLAGPIGPYAEKLAARLDKEIDFVFRGGEIKLDARALRPVFQNLAHVLRNSIDHGIELASERGDKPARGRVELVVEEAESAWTIAIVDDGRGIDPERVASLAVKKGFAKEEDVAKLDDSSKCALVFLDGFSTSDVATDISGRGIGMSAVKAAVEELGGSIVIDSTPGKGTRIALHVPKPKPAAQRLAA